MKVLLQHGAKINAVNRSERTALHEACGCGHISEAKILLLHGVNVNALDQWGNTALHSACRSRCRGVV